MKPRFLEIVPLVPSGASLAAAVTFYTEHLGFSVLWQTEGMAGIRRDGIALNLVANDNQAWTDNSSYSIGVSDLEALYQEVRHAPARVGPLEMKAWGRREFHMIVPSGVCLQFFEHANA